MEKRTLDDVAAHLAALYSSSFGGKPNGRYRISTRLVCQAAGRRRLYEDDIKALGRSLLELGYVLVDMDSFLVVLSANTFTNYRRANDDSVA